MSFSRYSARLRGGVVYAPPLAVALAAACCLRATCEGPRHWRHSARRALSDAHRDAGGGQAAAGDAKAGSAARAANSGASGSASSSDGNAAKGKRAQAPLISVVAAQGHRPYMEDAHFVARDGSFVGVYDGHGGSRVSAQLKKQLHSTFKQHWTQRSSAGRATADDATEALRQAFGEVDAAVQKQPTVAIEGSTCVVVVVPHLLPGGPDSDAPRVYLTANVGDSRAVLSRKGQALELTEDHKPNSPGERRRVERLGGTVKWFGYYDTEGKPVKGTGVWRINGNLAVSRAFGDRFDRPYVSGDCDLKSYAAHEGDDQFIIVASDGLWDVMSSGEAVQFVQSMMAGSVGALREGGGGASQGNRPSDVDVKAWSSQYSEDRGLVRAALMSRKKKMAKYLVEEALRRGTFDNITVAILWLK